MDLSLNRRRWMRNLGASILVAMATGCATGIGGAAGAAHPAAGSDKAALVERATAYWALVQKNDSVAAWKFEELSKDPAWTLEAYLKRGGVVYDAVEVREVTEMADDRAKVAVWMRYAVPLLRLKAQEAVAQDEWRLVYGQWFHARKALQ